MGRRINSSIYRVGRNISWDFFYPSIYFNKGMRFQIMFTLLIDRLMFLAGLRLIKVIINLEANKFKFFLIAVTLFKESPMARLFTDFEAGSFNIVSFTEPRGFIKGKDFRKYDTFYNDLRGENINEGALLKSPVSILDDFFENFVIKSFDTERQCKREGELMLSDLKMRRLASKAFLLYYIEKLSRSTNFNAAGVISAVSDIFKTKKADKELNVVKHLKKNLYKSSNKLDMLNTFFWTRGVKESKNVILLKKMFNLLNVLLACSEKKFLRPSSSDKALSVFFGAVILLRKKIFKSPKDFLYNFVIWLKKKNFSILKVVKKKNFMGKVVEKLGKKRLNQLLNRADDRKIYYLFFNFLKNKNLDLAPVKRATNLIAKKIKFFLKGITWCSGKRLIFFRLGWKRRIGPEYLFLKKRKLFWAFKKLICFSTALLVETKKKVTVNIADADMTALGRKKLIPEAWSATRLFRLEMEAQLSLIFNYNVELNMFLQNSIFALDKPARFLLNSGRLMSRVFIKRRDKPLLKYVFFIYFLSLFFRAPQCAVNMIVEALEFSRFHYGFLGPFRKLVALLNLKEFGLLGARIGLFGRLNGRDRKFKYYINFGNIPALRTLDLKVVYGQAQSIPRYGVVHVHIWYYYY